jgi:flagellar motor switch protein FliN
MTTSQSAGNARQSFSGAFFNALVAAITEASGAPWLVAAVPDAVSTADESEPVRVNLVLDGVLQGECLLEFRRPEAIMLASKCTREAASDFGPEQSRALLKVIQAAIDAFCPALAPHFGAFNIQAALVSERASEFESIAEITAGDDSGNRASIIMFLNPALDEALNRAWLRHAEADGGAEEPSRPEAFQENVGLPEQVNLDLVMDVELNVTLRFGQRQLALREVLELTSGSVIELDRQVEEPVELLLEGKVIARGEAVVIDGNYGLRVTEVPQAVSSSVRR